MRNAPPEASVTRFAHDLTALLEGGDGGGGDDDSRGGRPLLVAVSGGADSMALLLLTHAACPGHVEAATVDHGLRAQAAEEAAFVTGVCAELGIPHTILAAPMPDRVGRSANLSTRARSLRYALLDRHRQQRGCRAILTAHHADDQVETLIMRLNRASGLSGLSSIRSRNRWTRRPLLTWTRAELALIVQHSGFAWVDDPSNRDERFDRAKVRRMLAATPLFDAVAVAHSVAALAEADEALDAVAETMFQRLWSADRDTFDVSRADLPPELLRRVVLRFVGALDPQAAPRRSAVARIASLPPGERMMLGNVIVANLGLPVGGQDAVLRISRAPPRRERA